MMQEIIRTSGHSHGLRFSDFFLQLVLILGAQSETCGERTQMELSGKVQRKQGKDKSVHERTDEGRRGG